MGNAVLFGSTTLVLSVLVLGAEHCPTGKYRDRGTGNCDPCSDICEHRKQQGTETECRENCPDYDVKDLNPSDHGAPSGTSVISIVIPVVAVAVVAAVVVIVLLAIVRRKARPSPVNHAPETPAPPAETVPFCSTPTECTEESNASSAVSSTVEMNGLGEEAMMAHPDLPENNIYNATQSFP